VFAQIIFGGDFSKDFIAQKANVAVTDGIVERAAHGIFEGTLPFVGIRLDELEGRRTGGVGDVAGIDEDGDDDRNFLLSDEIVEDVEGGIVGVAMGVAAAILKNHDSCRSFGLVLGG